MSELRELYQEMILDHSRSPRNYQKIDGANRTAKGYNPLCGDDISLYVHVEDETIRNIGFQGTGCAISKASASLMTSAVKGKNLAQVREIFEQFHSLVTGAGSQPVDPKTVGKLAVFSGVSEFPTRVKCATLAWHTLREALWGEGGVACTE